MLRKLNQMMVTNKWKKYLSKYIENMTLKRYKRSLLSDMLK